MSYQNQMYTLWNLPPPTSSPSYYPPPLFMWVRVDAFLEFENVVSQELFKWVSEAATVGAESLKHYITWLRPRIEIKSILFLWRYSVKKHFYLPQVFNENCYKILSDSATAWNINLWVLPRHAPQSAEPLGVKYSKGEILCPFWLIFTKWKCEKQFYLPQVFNENCYKILSKTAPALTLKISTYRGRPGMPHHLQKL